ncbi:14954_t:CDS:2, partial [Dentiscutata heterogama]
MKSASSNTILNDLEQSILAKHLPHETLYYFGSDGTSVNLGHVNGIATQLKTRFPFLTEHYCISHRLALASKDAAEQTPYFETYDKIIRQLYSYFNILQVIKTQWLSLSNVVNNLYQIINLVISALLENTTKSQKTAQQLYNSIDQDFLIATHFLADILSQLHCLSLVFQADYVSVSEVTMQVNAVIESITADFIGKANIQPTFGTILLRFMNQQNILPHDLPLFLRFPDHKLISLFKIFDPKQLPTNHCLILTYGNYEITEIGNFYGTSKKTTEHDYQKIIDADNLSQEWRIIRSILSNYCNLHITDA